MIKVVTILFVIKIAAEEILTNISTKANKTNTSKPIFSRPKLKNSFEETLKDIAYYLRSHKFNEYDRRYETVPEKAPRDYYKHFPKPPLRSLHWEVRQFCEDNFTSCVEYLGKKLKLTGLKRTDDTIFIIKEQHWHKIHHEKLYKQVDAECKKMKEADDKMADPFAGPLERFQWRTTASYYMCWFTLQETPALEHLGEECDNFAACIDDQYGIHTEDPRVNDTKPFSCALYSFCPDPCCPFKVLDRLKDCWDKPQNPCYRLNPQHQRTCSLNFSLNTGFEDLILNRWNVSCNCPQKGYIWSSLYGLCIDIDECDEGETEDCDRKSEACLNLAGSYKCACKWGFIWSSKHNKCVKSAALELIKINEEAEKENKTLTFIQKVLIFFGKSGDSSVSVLSKSCLGAILLVLMRII